MRLARNLPIPAGLALRTGGGQVKECYRDFSPTITSTSLSMSKMEFYFYGDLDGHGVAILGCWSEFPLPHSINCCFVKVGAQCLRDADVGWYAIGTYNELQRNHPLMTCFLLLFRVLGFGSASLPGGCDAAHHIITVASTSN